MWFRISSPSDINRSYRGLLRRQKREYLLSEKFKRKTVLQNAVRYRQGLCRPVYDLCITISR